VPLAAVDISGKMGYSHAQRQTEEHRMDIAAEFMAATINAFEANKRLADRAIEQVPDDKLHTALDANTNSIAVILNSLTWASCNASSLCSGPTRTSSEFFLTPTSMLPFSRKPTPPNIVYFLTFLGRTSRCRMR
jgi:Protein of unknown function (DUF1572)